MIELLDYHSRTTDYLKNQTGLWKYFTNTDYKKEKLQEFKTELLKNSYKFDESSEPALYEKVNTAKQKLNLDLSVTLYQAQNTDEINASVVYVNNEIHIVFSGKLIELLTDEELLAVIAHELTHVHLYTQLNGEVEVTDRIINAIANNYSCTPVQYETARLFKLYTEIFCDRGSYLVTGSYAPIITSLVKIATGLQTVNADSYIKQAEEIFALDQNTKTSGISHPENFIRARAISLWHTKGKFGDLDIKQMMEGNVSIEELDLFRQQEISFITQQLVSLLLTPKWMQTPHTIALGKQYFPSLDLNGSYNRDTLKEKIEGLHPTIHDYLAYVLYDFTTSDKELEDVPLGYSFYLSDLLKLDTAFVNAVKKEKKLTEKKTNQLKKESLAEYHKQAMEIN